MDDLETAMRLIAGAGDSRSYCMEAIDLARAGDFPGAKKALAAAVEAMVEAHETQTELIRAEAEGRGGAVTLIMAHAQDHLNFALTMRDVAEETIMIYERISKLEEKMNMGGG